MTSSPNKIDFSKKATGRAVLRETIQHPVTLYSSAIGILGGLSMAMFNVTAITSGVAIGGFGLAATAWAVNYFFRNDTFVSRHIKSMTADIEAQTAALSKQLHDDLGKLPAYSKDSDLTSQIQRQFPMIKEKYDTFESLLRDKLSPSEITFARYQATAEQIYFSVLDNLSQLVACFKAIGAMDGAYIEDRLASIRTLAAPQKNDLDEKATLEKRHNILQATTDRINTLVTRNEEAITALMLASTAIAEMKTVKGRASTSLPTAIKDLEELAQRATQYSIDRGDQA